VGTVASKRIAIGMDVGSTTVKAVVCDADTLEILWSDYMRHETRQPEMVLEFLERIEAAFPDAVQPRIFCTGSGSGPLAPPMGAKFVQEVNAVTLAVEKLHPNVGSVIELGGQDAKIILFREENEDGKVDKSAFTSMNDKCASGTGATIDKCMIKVGMPFSALADLKYDSEKLHHVAAKCGVFAETDIVNLVKSGIPGDEILNSLADAIVHQNLSVLTRGNTLRHEVLLLGGPNTYLPFLVECWRQRIPETWESRGYQWPKDRPIEELVYVPQNAQYYAAFGAVVFGMSDAKARRGCVPRPRAPARLPHQRPQGAPRGVGRRPAHEGRRREGRLPRAVPGSEVRSRRSGARATRARR
jgi:activator of 2-hydroxyglutaryl-CoA dehydratase